MNVPVFVVRCRVCQHEIKTPWGPETHTQADAALSEHLRQHTYPELLVWVMRQHLVRSAATEDLCFCETVEEGWRPCPPSLCERSDHDHPRAATEEQI